MRAGDLTSEEIQKKSFSIIHQELGRHSFNSEELSIITRVIHATADLDYAADLVISPQAIKKGLAALLAGVNIITDVEMVRAGIIKKCLKDLSANLYCFINSPREGELTKAAAGINKAKPFLKDAVVVIGNAPTALEKLLDIIEEEGIYPQLIIATPVGFVWAQEAKERLRQTKDVAYITNRSKKGGSAVAVAIINALLLMEN